MMASTRDPAADSLVKRRRHIPGAVVAAVTRLRFRVTTRWGKAMRGRSLQSTGSHVGGQIHPWRGLGAPRRRTARFALRREEDGVVGTVAWLEEEP
ncbi:hypothetical protein PR202_gb00035 [Eleusine coracana subsp. coracana]|uniref:Uncharacterized protein n=1 Tax=Eleusine coracana subsp. coracana TaxID=191504 RepID=A0AAV5DSH7_ELECO|nr:hypothetical protein PR202_gb00035 [Eleusine coracana subsp. coracana]